MTKKHLRWIGILLLVAIALYLPRVLSNEEGRGTVTVEEGFAFHLTDPITRIEVHDVAEDALIHLERGQPEWTVDGYRIDQEKVDGLLALLPDLSSVDLVARNPANHEAFGVAETSGRRIDVYTEGGGPYSFYLGNRDPASGTYYVRASGDDIVYRLENDAAGHLSRDRDGWRMRLIAALEVDRVREIVIRRPEREMVIRREGDAWMFDGVPADSATMDRLVQLLPAVTASGFPTDAEAAAADFENADIEIDVFAEGGSDVTGRELVLGLIFLLDEEEGDWILRTVDGDEVYRLPAYVVTRLAPEPDDLIPE
jgi:hypothetical protein